MKFAEYVKLLRQSGQLERFRFRRKWFCFRRRNNCHAALR